MEMENKKAGSLEKRIDAPSSLNEIDKALKRFKVNENEVGWGKFDN